jgi:hypothetical protein
MNDCHSDELTGARLLPDGKVWLMFADGFTCTADLRDLGVPTTLMPPFDVSPSWRSALEIRLMKDGKPIHVDSAVLRANYDPAYAEKLRQAIAAVEAGGKP